MKQTKKPTRKAAMEAMCHHCMGYFIDGREDCRCINCPLYSWFCYAKLEPNLEWTQWNPKRIGKVKKEKSTRKGNPQALKEYREGVRNGTDKENSTGNDD